MKELGHLALNLLSYPNICKGHIVDSYLVHRIGAMG